ncbi:unnamed protein product [Effrenium voratum]|nr:unnamed protein product [Effrenium voratum]
MALRVAWALPLSLLLVLQGCENGAGGKDDKASCAHDDLMCLCKADCNETCNHFNITTVAQGTACAKCMTSKCAEDDAKSLCPKDQTSLCHNCVTEGAWCWATTWPSCVKQCVQWWEPIECTQCWLTNYTANCLGLPANQMPELDPGFATRSGFVLMVQVRPAKTHAPHPAHTRTRTDTHTHTLQHVILLHSCQEQELPRTHAGKYHDCFEPHVDAPALTGSNVSAVVV